MSKKVEFSVYSGSTIVKKQFDVHSAAGDKKIIGAAISQVFQFNERLKKYGANYIKANDEVSLVIAVNEESILDTYSLNSEYGFKLKFGGTAKSKRKFASCLNDLLTWASEEVKLQTLEEVISDLKED